jgi:hypothetical protein
MLDPPWLKIFVPDYGVANHGPVFIVGKMFLLLHTGRNTGYPLWLTGILPDSLRFTGAEHGRRRRLLL